MRRTITIALIIIGVLLMFAGFFFAAPWGSSEVADSDPVFLGAPTLFLFGILSILAAALFYELLPARDDDTVG
jgi:hypothetical protein